MFVGSKHFWASFNAVSESLEILLLLYTIVIINVKPILFNPTSHVKYFNPRWRQVQLFKQTLPGSRPSLCVSVRAYVCV